MSNQIEMISLEELVPKSHQYRRLIEVFTFVDASHLISKAALWEERDELIKQKYDKINNDNISKVAHDMPRTHEVESVSIMEMDEMWHFIQKKKQMLDLVSL